MITRIVWLVSLLFAVGAAQEREEPLQDFVFNAIVQDSGTFLGAKCDYAKEKCAAYERKLCRFLQKPLLPLEGPPDFCKMLSHSDRTKENTITVQMKLTLYKHVANGGLIISVHNPNFVAALNQGLIYLYNTPEASITITSIVPPSVTPETEARVVPSDFISLHVKGTLYWKQQTKDYSKIEDEEKCDLEKQLFNLDMGSDLLNMMYKYTKKHIKLLPFDQESPDKVVFAIYYPKEFLQDTGFIDTNYLAEKLQWGFRNPASTKAFYLGTDTVVTVKQPADSHYEAPETIPFVLTAFVKDDGKLNGEKCDGPHQKCTEYKQRLCQLAQTPLFCGRVPTDWDTCSVNILSKREPDGRLKANINLRVQEVAKNMYPINYDPLDSCSTFAGMYKLAFASQSANPKLDLIEFTPPLKPVALRAEVVDVQIRGTLQHKGQPIKSEKWKHKSKEEAKADLGALVLPEAMLNTFYHSPSRKLKALEIDTNSELVNAMLTISYPKTVFEENAIDPGCDLNGMLQWGFRSVKTTKGYSFSAKDTVVQNSAAIERSTSFTFRATVTDNGKFQGAACSGVSGQCIEYKEKLCAFVKKAFISSEITSGDDCLIEILSNRKEENKDRLDVRISLQLNMHTSKLQFDVNCPTFGWVLNEAFQKLYNTPDAKLTVTAIETLQLPFEPPSNIQVDEAKTHVVYEVTGSLYQNGKLVNLTKSQDINQCEVDKQIATLDMGEDLLNVMYMYNKDKLFSGGEAVASKDNKEPSKFSFKLYYDKTFFETEDKRKTINPNCDFADKLQWGFRHPVSKQQFYMGEDTTVTRASDADPLESQALSTIKYTAKITDADKLNGIECDPKSETCTEYAFQLCKLIQEPLLCNRIPIRPDACTISEPVKTKFGEAMTADIALIVRKEYKVGDKHEIPPILQPKGDCPTFAALHKLAFETFYDSPIVDLGIKPLSQEKADALKDPVVFTVTGKLTNEKGEEVTKVEDLFELNYQLANLNMPSRLLQAVYKYNKERTFEPIKSDTLTGGAVEFKVGFKKDFLTVSGIDPNCDLADMLEWGFKQSPLVDRYRFEVTDVAL